MSIGDVKESIQQLQKDVVELEGLLSIAEKKDRITALITQTNDPAFWNNPDDARRQSQLLSNLQEQVESSETLHNDVQELLELTALEEASISEKTVDQLLLQYQDLQKKYRVLSFQTLFDGKYDDHHAILSIHAGAGGTEAQDWAQMLLRMITRYAESKGWAVRVLDESKGQEAGIKSITVQVAGAYAYGYLQSEHGTHRLVRISPFDGEAMRHTSFANIEVIPEIENAEAVTIDPKELRIDTFMSGGKGGQSVNTTYSAVRVVHVPTGITVSCQNERSQAQNKETALKILQAKLQVLQEQEEAKKRQELRGEVKSAEWGNQIRSYVLHPYKLVKDVRSKKESTDPDDVLNGNLDVFIEAFLKWKKER